MADGDAALHLPAQFVTVHAGHHHVADDHIHLLAFENRESLDPVVGREETACPRFELPFQIGDQLLVVLDDQQRKLRQIGLRHRLLDRTLGRQQLIEVVAGLADDPFAGQFRRQFEIEDRTPFGIVPGTDPPAVLFDQDLGIGEAYSRPGPFVVALVEAGEEAVGVDPFQAAAAVDHRDPDTVPCLVQLRAHRNAAPVRTVFQRVDQQIAQHDHTLSGIEIPLADPRIGLHPDLDSAFIGLESEILDHLPHPTVQILHLRLERGGPGLHLAQGQHHVDQLLHALRLLVDAAQQRTVAARIVRRADQPPEGPENQREGRSQFVADVDQEADLVFGDLLLVAFEFALQAQLLAAQQRSEEPQNRPRRSEDPQHREPSGAVPRRIDLTSEHLLPGDPLAVTRVAGRLDEVAARDEVAQRQFGIVRVDHLAVVVARDAEPVEPLAEEVVLAYADPHDERLVSPRDVDRPAGQEVVEAFAVEHDVEGFGLGEIGRIGSGRREEIAADVQQTIDSAQIEVAVGGCQTGLCLVLVPGGPLRLAEGNEPPHVGQPGEDPLIGTDPDPSAGVADDALHAAVEGYGHPFAGP